MHRVSNFLPFSLAIFLTLLPAKSANPQSTDGIRSDELLLTRRILDESCHILGKTRQFPSDLEVDGDLAGLPRGGTRYVTREDLLAFPQVKFTAAGDQNFAGSPAIEGITLEGLVRRLSRNPGTDLVVAICDDEYRAMYPRAYMVVHRPVLVLKVNGQPPFGWPKDANSHSSDMGPYMISST